MDFHDQPHLHQLQKDLWKWPSSRAALMVGAGFSLNSEPLPGIDSRFPTWRELVRSMFDEIYPVSPSATASQIKERHEHFVGVNMLRLASEFEAAFGRQKLDQLIRDKNPDSEHIPGSLHRLLLQLPWKDVFTTNYDTLLERTEVQGRAYQPVTTVGDLTVTFSPRIVKLHGSFPSQTPFLVTEEDYRTYPRNFAPFVNTVQQALIENCLVMIGFSGDDPNFLQWIGWIRDHLGIHHAPIYLVGPLSLGNAQRTLLDRRGVTPIDLSPIFATSNPTAGIYSASLEWFFRSLAAAKPKRPGIWTSLGLAIDHESSLLPPVITLRTEDPPEGIELAPTGGADLSNDDVSRVFSRWSYERKCYPGWLVAPYSKRSDLWRNTRFWIPGILKCLDSWAAVDRVIMLRELNWRLETVMIPIVMECVDPIEKAIDELLGHLENHLPLGSVTPGLPFAKVSHSEIVDAWYELAFGLLREARETYNVERWLSISEKIRSVLRKATHHQDRFNYEECLWLLFNVRRVEAKKILSEWQISTNSPRTAMWKAGLLAELGDFEEALSILRKALQSIRTGLLRQGQNIELLSTEGWCTYLIRSVELQVAPTAYSFSMEEFVERWAELKAYDCDPWSVKNHFDEALSGSVVSRKQDGRRVVRGFDAGDKTISYRWSGDDEHEIQAFSYIRLFEQVGIPMHLRNVDVGGKALPNACKQIDSSIGHWAAAIFVRAGRGKELKEYDFFSRVGVATMHQEVAERLHRWGVEALEREVAILDSHVGRDSWSESLLEILPELLSRLAFRVDEDAIDRAFHLALRYHNAPGIRSHISLHEKCDLWFKRIYDSAVTRQLLTWLPLLIRSPFFDDGVRSYIPPQNAWPDPMRHFPSGHEKFSDDACSDLLPEIEEAVGWLLKRAGSENGEAYTRVFVRLLTLFQGKLMTANQEQEMGVLIWRNVPVGELPNLPLASFAYLYLPNPQEIDVFSLVRSRLLSLEPKRSVSYDENGKMQCADRGVDQMISEVTMATKSVVKISGEFQGVLKWSKLESKLFWERVVAWWNIDKAFLDDSSSRIFLSEMIADSILGNLKRLDLFLTRAVCPNIRRRSEKQEVINFAREAKLHGVYLMTCLPYLLIGAGSQREEIEVEIREGLKGRIDDAVTASARALRHWLSLALAGEVDPPSPDMLDILVGRVVYRRPQGLKTCIDHLSFMLKENSTFFSKDQIKMISGSLVAWFDAIELSSEGLNEGEFPVEERPDLRVSIGMLASALLQWQSISGENGPECEEIRIWKEACARDPLPEVKRLFGASDG